MGNDSCELVWAEPFADALVSDANFRAWVLGKTEFARRAEGARVLNKEMMAKRTKDTKYWWRSHYQAKCHCFGCSGQETDLLAVFEGKDRTRFAIHVEVKYPGDKFTKTGQAAAYPVRAQCWVRSTPAKVLPHTEATTMLLCSEGKLSEFAPHLKHFANVVTFEEIAEVFPHATMPLGI